MVLSAVLKQINNLYFGYYGELDSVKRFQLLSQEG